MHTALWAYLLYMLLEHYSKLNMPRLLEHYSKLNMPQKYYLNAHCSRNICFWSNVHLNMPLEYT